VNDLRVDKVETKSDLKSFIRFPWNVYKDDAKWVPPLIMEMKEKLDKVKNPFFEHSEMDLFLARRGGDITGRIAAILDRNHNAFHDEKIAFFGLYESLNDQETARALLDTVARWGKDRGMDVLRGPMNLSMNDECAFIIEGFDSPPVIMMPYNPRYYLELMENCGLAKAKDLYAFFITRDHRVAEKISVIVEKVRRETKITLRALKKRTLDQDVEKIVYVYNAAWEKNWGFVPWTTNEMKKTVDKLKQIADLRLVILAEDAGRPVAFAFGLPNYNEVLKKMNGRLTPLSIAKFLYYRKRIKSMRAIVFGILKEYRQTGLSYYLYSDLEKNALAAGYEWGEMSWQLEDNEPVNKFNLSIGGKLYKKYRIYEKRIA
jgi:GNAT superfamily N-acetyltransferase